MSTDFDHRKVCFVIHSDPQQGLGGNRIYEDVIKPAVTSAGLECIRADGNIDSTPLDRPMHELLFHADLVIAYLSTSTANILYELGIRHALRPHGTIVLADETFTLPFELPHIQVSRYQHPGSSSGRHDVKRMQDLLQDAIAQWLRHESRPSP